MKKLLSVILFMAIVLSCVTVCFAGNDMVQAPGLRDTPLILTAPEEHNVMLTVSSTPAKRVVAHFNPLPSPDALNVIQAFGKESKTTEVSRGDILALLWTMSSTPYVDYWMLFEDMDYDGPNTEAYRWAQRKRSCKAMVPAYPALMIPSHSSSLPYSFIVTASFSEMIQARFRKTQTHFPMMVFLM